MFKARLQLSLAENVFCQGMVILLNPVFILLSEMLDVYKSEVNFPKNVALRMCVGCIQP